MNFGSLNQYEDSLLGEFRRMEREIDHLLGRSPWSRGIRSVARGGFPAVNIGVTEDTVDVYLFAPGVDPQTLDVSLRKNLLTVSGSRNAEPRDDATYYRQERFSGDFRRVITLPDDVDPDRVEASYRNGVLQIAVKRLEAAKPRQITVQ